MASMFDITEEERNYLRELLEAKRTELFHELHHTDARDFKEFLRERLALVEGLSSKLAEARPPGAD